MVGLSIPGHSDSEDELPPGWEERSTLDGHVYYVDHSAQETRWHHPRTGKQKRVPENLPLGWNRLVDNEGKVLYVEESTGRTSAADPRIAFAVEMSVSACSAGGGGGGAMASVPRQRYDASSTALHVLHGLDLHGQVAMVTGANTGIGYEIARALCLHACTVIMACRDLVAARAAAAAISGERATAQCHVVHCDLADLSSVRQCARHVLQHFRRLDMLILNAAVFGVDYTRSVQGYELHFAVNHLGHYYLTRLLRPVLVTKQQQQQQQTHMSRVVVVSSESHRMSSLTVETMSRDTLSRPFSSYFAMAAYNDSKFCNNVFASELNRRWFHKGVLCVSVHPGNMVSTQLSRHWWLYRWLFAAVRPFTKSRHQAAATPVFAATAPEVPQWCATTAAAAVYLNNCWPCDQRRAASDGALGNKLWLLSQQMIAETLGADAFSSDETAGGMTVAVEMEAAAAAAAAATDRA